MERNVMWNCLAAVAALSCASTPAPAGEPMVAVERSVSRPAAPARAGAPGGPGLAVRAAKILTCAVDGPPVVDNGVMLVRDGKIEAVGPARTLAVPADYEVFDAGARWLSPGFIDLHSHVAGTWDINDSVLLANPELRAYCSVVPDNPNFERAIAGGVTTVLYIPGSGVNISGQGVLLKTGFDRYEEMEVRNPGSLKLAQSGNPERWVSSPQRSFMNWNTRNTFRRGMAYAERWSAFEAGDGPEPEFDPQFEVFRALEKGETQVSTHTQMYQVVNETLTMVKGEFGLDVYIDHGEFEGYRAAPRAQAMGVNAILGPRSVEIPIRGMINWVGLNTDGRFQGIAAAYQAGGHKKIGLNTDAPVVPEEELFVQATVAVRYGFDDSALDIVRALTIVPAMTAGIDHRVGSLEPGKDADVLVLDGHPADPRSAIDRVWIEGRLVYDTAAELRRF